MIEPVWANRNNLLKRFNFADASVVDFGCGDKSVLNYITVKEYIGLDRVKTADIIIDFNNEKVNLEKTYDVGLVLGVLEYLENPKSFLETIKPFANKFYILMLTNRRIKIHDGWKNAFTNDSAKNLLSSAFKYNNYYEEGGYFLAECVK